MDAHASWEEHLHFQIDQFLIRNAEKWHSFRTIFNSKYGYIKLENPCCYIKITRRKQKVFVELLLLYVKDCDYSALSGNDYLDMINVFLDDVFVRNTDVQSLLRQKNIEKVIFTIPVDESEITSMPTLVITDRMYRKAREITEGKTFESITLKEAEPQLWQEPRLKAFFDSVLIHDFPTIYDGSMYVKEFVNLVYNAGLSSIVFVLLRRMLYEFVHVIRPTDEDTSASMEEPYKMSLHLLSSLSRDDGKTWYMRKTGVGPCTRDTSSPMPTGGEYENEDNANLDLKESLDPEEYTARILEFQHSKFEVVLPEPKRVSRKYFESVFDLPIRSVIQSFIDRSRTNSLTYYDAVLYDAIVQYVNRVQLIDPYLDYACKTVWHS
jgi:hypothetical protein